MDSDLLLSTLSMIGMLAFIVASTVAFFSSVSKNSKIAAQKKSEKQELIKKININLHSLKNNPDNDVIYNQVMTAWQDKRLIYFEAVANGWIKKTIELCELYPEKMIAWRMLKDFQDKRILGDKKIDLQILNVSRAGLLKVFGEKGLRDFIVSIIDKIVAANKFDTDILAKSIQLYEEIYHAALDYLENSDLDNQTKAKVIALDMGRLMYRGKITVQDEQKIQNDILVRSKK